MKQLQVISYEYPDQIRLQISNITYTYQSSEFFCRKFLSCYVKGGRFNTLNWFKRYARMVEKEVNKHEKVVC